MSTDAVWYVDEQALPEVWLEQGIRHPCEEVLGGSTRCVPCYSTMIDNFMRSFGSGRARQDTERERSFWG